ncbi:anthranilate synthase component I family protein [Psychrobacter sp. SWN149]|uniref:anthranilate synthase component I family protein n=1 Tax=Psychrobacter sp. SWN149 TaxID=2792057 RepID=UPI0018CE917A|nr:anthranilate synthase component I family protein [Psychrobacter sp. SWN149]MBH0007570.1 anthranilate synthase component I family protein [Psychrobacter sp. SWN149]
MLVPNQHTTEQTDSVPSPAIHRSWRFGDLTAAELMPHLQRHLSKQDNQANWQLVWLDNDNQPVIGLLPKVSWLVYPADNQPSESPSNTYKVIKTCRETCSRNDNVITTTFMSYLAWQDALITYSNACEADSISSNTINKSSSGANSQSIYSHGLIGYIGYDMAAYELSPADSIELATQPCASLGHYDIYLTPSVDHALGWELMVIRTLDDNNGVTNESLLVSVLISYLDELDKNLSDSSLNHRQSDTISNTSPVILDARWHKRDYQQAFEQTQNYLQQGDCYQINLTQEWFGWLPSNNDSRQSNSALIDYLPALHRNTQAPFAGYLSIDGLDIGDLNHNHANANPNHFELLSCSPELFFTFTKDKGTGTHHILTKPIKGTMPRGSSDEQDQSYKQTLMDSEKDRAENVMIVDLLRNDLGKYAKIGSVKVPQLFAIESFSNVHHMVSTITAELKAETHPLTVLFGSLPAGSITGTPKKRAVEIIAELESVPRGAYCGTMGYMNFDGSGQWNVLIRTLQANSSSIDDKKMVSLWAGGGITVASSCDAEYQECLDKVGNLLAVLTQDNLSNQH